MNLESKKIIEEQLNLKKLLIASIVGGFTMWILAGLWHTILAVHFYKNETNAEHEGLSIILIAYIILGFLMAYLYIRIGKKTSVMEGFGFGAIMGILWVFPHELAMAGAHGESISYVVKNGLWHVVEQGVGGIFISLVYKYPSKDNPRQGKSK